MAVLSYLCFCEMTDMCSQLASPVNQVEYIHRYLYGTNYKLWARSIYAVKEQWKSFAMKCNETQGALWLLHVIIVCETVGHALSIWWCGYDSYFSSKNDPFILCFCPMLRGVSTSHFSAEKHIYVEHKVKKWNGPDLILHFVGVVIHWLLLFIVPKVL